MLATSCYQASHTSQIGQWCSCSLAGVRSTSIWRGTYTMTSQCFTSRWIAALLVPHLGLDLRTILYPTRAEEADGAMNSAVVFPAALFVVEYALARLWMAWGVRPQAMIGHSLGEYIAACLAGVFSLEDALAIIARRGQLFD
jgi:malonyl CoA-acyl carrier protein transacylase